eukprot:NODE_429_length_8748_cov_0.280148.p4 type:complete len:320 gc:universal NODE_429_length_8748_cov_0.280148:7961-7002(-)
MISWCSWIFTNSKDLDFELADNTLEYDGITLVDLYTKIKKKTWNSMKRWTIIIKNSEIYFTTRTNEILRVIKYVHTIRNVQLIMISTANFHRIKPTNCWFYPKIILVNSERKLDYSGLESMINQTFEPIGVSNQDMKMLCLFWQRVLDKKSMNYTNLLKFSNLMSCSKMLIERKVNPEECLERFDGYMDFNEIPIRVSIPYYQKYFACAVFIGCFIPMDNDKHLFVNDNRSKRTKRRKMTPNRLQLGPLPCSIIRILAIFKMLMPTHEENLNLLGIIWDLKDKNLIHVNDINILCLFDYGYALECAKSIDLKMANYFEY